MGLPPFPVDDRTLEMLDAALDPRSHGDPAAESSSLWPFLEMMSQLGGADTQAVQEESVGNTPLGVLPTRVMRDPHYSDHCLIRALRAEVGRQREILRQHGLEPTP